MKVKLARRELDPEEILEIGCPICKVGPGEWCVSTREAYLLLKTLHPDRAIRAHQRMMAKDYRKAQKRLAQIREDTERYNAQRHELAMWVIGGQLYVWLKEYGAILWELGEEDG